VSDVFATPKGKFLRAALEAQRWRVTANDRDPGVWWAAELVQLESTWSPQSAVIWIAFLVDPMAEISNPNPPVWAVGASSRRPEARHDAGDIATLSLGRPFRRECPMFLEALHAYRQQHGKPVA
jgi:hypothetical protein